MKKILIVAGLLLLGVGLAVFGVRRFAGGTRPSPTLQGNWEGTLGVNGARLRLVLKVERSPDGGYRATMDSIDQSAKDIPISLVTLSNLSVRLELTSLNAVYEGELDAGATAMSGHWRQAGLTNPLTLRRTAKPSSVAGALPAASYARRPDVPLQGYWKGTLEAGGVNLRLVVKLARDASGQFRGTLDSLDQGARDLPMSAVEFVEPAVRFEIGSIGGRFEGTLKEDASALDGQWTQLGQKFHLLLQRGDPQADASAAAAGGSYQFSSASELQGFWNGTLVVSGAKLRLGLKIAKGTNGSYHALLDSLDQGARDIPATSVKFKDSDVELEWTALRALFHGSLEGGKLSGFWQQGSAEFPLEFERTNQVSTTAPPVTGR